MNKTWYYIILSLFLSSCQAKDQDKVFRIFLENFQQRKSVLWHGIAPQTSTGQSSSILKIPEAEIFSSNLIFCKNQLIALQKIDPGQLSQPFRNEYDKTLAYLNSTIHQLEVEKIHEKQTSFYDVMPFFEKLISSGQLDLLHDNLGLLPVYYEMVKFNLKSPDPKDLENAIEREKAFYQLLRDKIPKAIQSIETSEDIQATSLLLASAKTAVKDYIAYLISLQFEFDNLSVQSLQKLPKSTTGKKNKRND